MEMTNSKNLVYVISLIIAIMEMTNSKIGATFLMQILALAHTAP